MTDERTECNGIEDDDAINETTFPVHPLAFDWAIYAHHLKESDLTGEQQRQLIETLWTIASLFVDYGFGLHPVQQVCDQEACGEEADLAALVAEDMLCWDEHSEHDIDDKRSTPIGIDMATLPEGSPV